MSNPPQISVVIPTYNRAKVVGKALESVFAQSLQPAEIIVVNDGSKDDTREVLASYGNRITAINQENGGLSAARNAGIQAATTEWIAFLDDDDEYAPDRLAIAVETIARHPDIDVHATNTALVDADGSELDMFAIRGRSATEHMRLERPLGWVLGGCFFAQTLVARKNAIVGAGLFRKTFYEDMDLFVRLAARGPWTVDVRRSLRLQRLEEEDPNLSSVWRSKPVENYEALTRIHREALAIPSLTAGEKRFVESGLATNLFELGRALHARGETTRARECFREAGRRYPRIHSRAKAHAAALFGAPVLRVFGMLRRQRGVFRSVPVKS
jgi:glycosyltransferase involved in cell wall biosynthesis